LFDRLFSNGYPCKSSPLSIIAQFPVLTISGNTISTTVDIHFKGSKAAPPEYAGASAMFNDTFAIPNSPPGDVLNVDVSYGGGGFVGGAISFQIGPGSASSPEINLDPSIQPPAYCPPGNTRNCRFSGTLPASSFSFLTLKGGASLEIVANDPDPDNSRDSFGYFYISRFKADGTTPDPFTPEPASYGLASVGLILLGFLGFRQRAKVNKAGGVRTRILLPE
jgi:hypothetical protein